MAKKTLIDFSFDFNIWGINSGMEDYRLCQFLNHHMKWKMKRTLDIEFYNRSIKKLEHFNTYKYTNEIDLYTVELIQNKIWNKWELILSFYMIFPAQNFR